jgi:hypothetical protein
VSQAETVFYHQRLLTRVVAKKLAVVTVYHQFSKTVGDLMNSPVFEASVMFNFVVV